MHVCISRTETCLYVTVRMYVGMYVCVSHTETCPYVTVFVYICIHSLQMHTKEDINAHSEETYWRMQNNCTTSDRLKRFVFQRCRLLLVVNVKKKHAQCKCATLYGYETVARWAIILHTPVPVFFLLARFCEPWPCGYAHQQTRPHILLLWTPREDLSRRLDRQGRIREAPDWTLWFLWLGYRELPVCMYVCMYVCVCVFVCVCVNI
jgi:hypothetical protein